MPGSLPRRLPPYPHPRCGHASGQLRDYVRAARGGPGRDGLRGYYPLIHLRDPHLTMDLEEMPLYLAEVEELRADFPDLPIRLGIEADYVPRSFLNWRSYWAVTLSIMLRLGPLCGRMGLRRPPQPGRLRRAGHPSSLPPLFGSWPTQPSVGSSCPAPPRPW